MCVWLLNREEDVTLTTIGDKIFFPQLEVPAPDLASTEVQLKVLVKFGYQPDVQGIYELLVAGLRPKEVVRSMS